MALKKVMRLNKTNRDSASHRNAFRALMLGASLLAMGRSLELTKSAKTAPCNRLDGPEAERQLPAGGRESDVNTGKQS